MNGLPLRVQGGLLILVMTAACGRIWYDPRSDAGPDGNLGDAEQTDDAMDGMPLDASTDAASLDASTDEASVDANTDEMSEGDAGSPPGSLRVVFPWNGLDTGTPHGGGGTADPRRPRFVWLPEPLATRYELQVDDSCSPTDFTSCTFPSPELESATALTTFRPDSPLPVALTPPVGARYFWRARACNAHGCGAYSEPRYLNVGRARDDLNGDGYGDLAAGSREFSGIASRQGIAYVFYGSPGTASDDGPDVVLTSPSPMMDGGFGVSIAALGDLNADGFADLGIGAPNANLVYV